MEKTITPELIKKVRKEVDDALVEVGKRNGLTLQFQRASYDDYEFTAKLVCRLVELDGKSFEQLSWESKCELYDLEKSDWGKKFKIKNEVYTVSDINTRKTRFPIVAVRESDQGRFIFEVEQIKKLLNK